MRTGAFARYSFVGSIGAALGALAISALGDQRRRSHRPRWTPRAGGSTAGAFFFATGICASLSYFATAKLVARFGLVASTPTRTSAAEL